MSALRGFATLSFAVIVASACADQKFVGRGHKSSEAQPVNSSSSTGKELFTGAQKEPYKVDIIYLLDGSPSMKDNVKKATDNLKGLTENFLSQKKGLDYQIYIVGQGFTIPVVNDLVEHVNQYVGSNSALSNAQLLITGKYETKLKLRPDSVKELLVVSDDNSDQTEASFLKFMDDNPDVASNVHVNSIVAHSKCGGYVFGIYRAKVGQVYLDLGKNPRTAGAMGDLCETDWGAIFQQLGKSLTEFKIQPRVRVKLKAKPSAPEKLTVKINGSEVGKDKFSFDSATNEVIINTETTEQDKIEVMY